MLSLTIDATHCHTLFRVRSVYVVHHWACLSRVAYVRRIVRCSMVHHIRCMGALSWVILVIFVIIELIIELIIVE